MGYKTILVHCDGGRTSRARAAVAAALAERFDAHLIGLHIRQRFEAPMFTDATIALDALYRTYEQATKTQEQASRAAFEGALSGKRLSNEWRVVDGYAEDAMAAEVRYVDLVVVGQRDPEPMPESTPAHLPEQLAMHSERPILVVPHIGVEHMPGRSVMVCWNGRREASRAVAGALPLLEGAERVTLLTIDGEHGNEHRDAAAHAAEWLGRHGVKLTVQRDNATDSDVGDVILSRAADASVDLIVMGIYGHSRMRQFVLGGVSRTLLASMTVPLLIAH
jgi:nucleotide-binding universal stress UspA family protein